MSVTKEQVIKALRRIKGPDLESNIVDLGLVSDVMMQDGRAYFSITIPSDRSEELEPLRKAATKVVEELDGIRGVTAVLTAEVQSGARSAGQAPDGRPHKAKDSKQVERARQQVQAPQLSSNGKAAPSSAQGAAPSQKGNAVPGVRHLIAVASGKGGVGKSTTAVNLALGFQALGHKVGILDADIYGPSQPRLLGITGRPTPVLDSKMLNPLEGYGIKVMSMGFMIDEDTPVIWRGPMVVSALNQMLREVLWGDLDVLVIDMPPGTGDVQLTMAQQVPLSGAVIVSTPQDLALIDARKGLNMFRKVDVPVLGIIENMSYFICPSCGERSDIFGHGGAESEAEKLGVPFLGGVPLHMEIRETSDSGHPIAVTSPESPHAALYREIANKTWQNLQNRGDEMVGAPKIVFD